jgi:hypothetical protein
MRKDWQDVGHDTKWFISMVSAKVKKNFAASSSSSSPSSSSSSSSSAAAATFSVLSFSKA